MFKIFYEYQELQHPKSLTKTSTVDGIAWEASERCASVRHLHALSLSKWYINSPPGFTSSFDAPVSAVLTVEPSGTRLPAELPSVSRCAGTRAVCLVALPMDALAVSFAALPPQSFPALAASRELVAR